MNSSNLPTVEVAVPENGSFGPTQWTSNTRLHRIAIAALLLSAVSLVWLFLPVFRRRASSYDRSCLLIAVVLFALAVAVRVATPWSLANWYAEVLPVDGPAPSARFGPGHVVVQQWLRALFPWREGTLMLAQQVVGAVMIPLAVAFVHALALPPVAAAATGLFVALAPLHVRASSSPSEHVLSATLTMALFLLWIRGVRQKSMLSLLLCLPLMVGIVLTRVDGWPFLIAVPLFPLATEVMAARRWAGWAAVVYATAWGLVGACAWFAIVGPSHHPHADGAEMLSTAIHLFSQYGRVATAHPYWYSPVAVVLALPGIVWLAFRRLRLLAALGLALACGFVPLGRQLTHDGLLGARYFLATLPFSLLPAGLGFAILLEAVYRRLAERNTRAVRGLGLAASAGLFVTIAGPAIPAYRYRYAFQDEYAELRKAVTVLPDGCVVASLPVRHASFGLDLDASLDLARSPLPLAHPQLRFITLPLDVSSVSNAAFSCMVYYETSACSIQFTAEVQRRFQSAFARYRTACREMRNRVAPEPLWTREVSANATNDLFGGIPPRVSLLWWRRP